MVCTFFGLPNGFAVRLEQFAKLFYCKKVLKKTPKTQYGFEHYIKNTRGRKKKIVDTKDGMFSSKKKAKPKAIKAGVTDNNLSQFFSGQ